MCAHPLGFCRFSEILNIFKDKNHQIVKHDGSKTQLPMSLCVASHPGPTNQSDERSAHTCSKQAVLISGMNQSHTGHNW